MNYDFKDKVVLVTGASRGIGKAIATSFAKCGAQVIINYNKSKNEAYALERSLKTSGFKAQSFKADVSSSDAVQAMIDHVVKEYGGLDIIVNNAGIRKDGFIAMMADSDWEEVVRVNLDSVYHLSKWAVRVMIRNRKGKIINISSLSALTGMPGQTNYAASKGGVISFTRSLAKEVGSFGICVNAIVPGLIETDMTTNLKDKNEIIKAIALGRIGQPQDICGAVLFLASAEADYITGQSLVVDGGIY